MSFESYRQKGQGLGLEALCFQKPADVFKPLALRGCQVSECHMSSGQTALTTSTNLAWREHSVGLELASPPAPARPVPPLKYTLSQDSCWYSEVASWSYGLSGLSLCFLRVAEEDRV